ncbi:MAG: transposase [Methylorubrum populi]
MKSNHGRTRLNLNGALSWPDRSLIHHQEEKITSAAMIRLFETLAACHPAAESVTVVLDNARYNRSRELRTGRDQPDGRLRLVYLPSYAPNLNLIERFWHFMKRKVLFNKAYAKFALFKQAFDDFFQRLHEHQADLVSLITDRFHLIGQTKTGMLSA